MNDAIKKLSDRIEKLEKDIMILHSGNTIPIWLDQALVGRGFIKASTGSTGSFGTQSITVTTTPQTITPPAQPSGTVSLVIRGTSYNLIFA